MAKMTWSQIASQAEEMRPVPAGTYKAVCTSAEAAVTRTNKDMIKVQYTVQTGPEKGNKVFGQFVLSPESPQAMGFLMSHIEAHGIDLSKFGSAEFTDVAPHLVGCEVEITVAEGEYEGRKTANIRSFNKIASNKPRSIPQPAGPPPPPPALNIEK